MLGHLERFAQFDPVCILFPALDFKVHLYHCVGCITRSIGDRTPDAAGLYFNKDELEPCLLRCLKANLFFSY